MQARLNPMDEQLRQKQFPVGLFPYFISAQEMS